MPRRERSARSPAKKSWRRKGGGRDDKVTSCLHPVRGEERSSGQGQVVDSQATNRGTSPWQVCRFLDLFRTAAGLSKRHFGFSIFVSEERASEIIESKIQSLFQRGVEASSSLKRNKWKVARRGHLFMPDLSLNLLERSALEAT
jgi:hypothetical protein